MPSKPKKPCPSCKVTLVKEGYCDRCSKKKHKDYKKVRLDDKEQAFYNSTRWRKLSAHKKKLTPYCEDCYEKEGIVKPVEVTDHIVELKDEGGWELRLTLSNLRSLCNSCHQKKTYENRKSRRQGQG